MYEAMDVCLYVFVYVCIYVKCNNAFIHMFYACRYLCMYEGKQGCIYQSI